MTIHKSDVMPKQARIGDAWTGVKESFYRVYSRGHAWENAVPGKHPDEDESHGKIRAESQVHVPEVGSAQSAQGVRDDGKGPAGSGEKQGRRGEEVPSLTGGIDGTTPPVV